MQLKAGKCLKTKEWISGLKLQRDSRCSWVLFVCGGAIGRATNFDWYESNNL
jgi:hypothetical protein